MTADPGYGTCPDCQRQQALRADGNLARHHVSRSGQFGPYVVRCPGSGKPPKPTA